MTASLNPSLAFDGLHQALRQSRFSDATRVLEGSGFHARTLLAVTDAVAGRDEALALALYSQAAIAESAADSGDTETLEKAWMRYAEFFSPKPKISSFEPVGMARDKVRKALTSPQALPFATLKDIDKAWNDSMESRRQWLSRAFATLDLSDKVDLGKRPFGRFDAVHFDIYRSRRDVRFGVTLEKVGRQALFHIEVPHYLHEGPMTETELQRWVALALLESMSPAQGGRLTLTRISRVDERFSGEIMEWYLSMRDALVKLKFDEFLPLLNLDKGLNAVVGRENLLTIERGIAERNPKLGIALYEANIAIRYGLPDERAVEKSRRKMLRYLQRAADLKDTVRTTVDGPQKRMFAELGNTAAPPITYQNLVAISEKMNSSMESRGRWVQDAIAFAGAAGAKLKDSGILSNPKWNIHFLVRRGEEENYSITSYVASRSTSDHSAMVYIINIPRSRTTVFTEREIQQLFGKAILGEQDKRTRASVFFQPPRGSQVGESLHFRLSLGMEEATEPSAAVIMGPNGVVASRTTLKREQLDDVESAVQWFYTAQKALHGRRQLLQRRPLDDVYLQRLPPADIPERWRELFASRDAALMLDRAMQFARNPFGVTVTISSHLPEGDILIGRISGGTNEVAPVQMAQSTFAQLTGEDMLKLYWEIANLGPLKRTERYAVGWEGMSQITLSNLRDGHGPPGEELENLGTFLLTYRYRSFERLQKEGEHPLVRVSSPKVQADVQAVLKAIGLQMGWSGSPVEKQAWGDILHLRGIWVEEVKRGGDQKTMELIPAGDVLLVKMVGDPEKFQRLDWLYALSLIASSPAQAFRLEMNGNSRWLSVGLNPKLADFLFGFIEANPVFAGLGLHRPMRAYPADISMVLPGGISVESNPSFKKAPAEVARNYLRALIWFASSGLPAEYQPTAKDTRDEAGSKKKAMGRAYHPDVRGGQSLEREWLYREANNRFEDVLKIYDFN